MPRIPNRFKWRGSGSKNSYDNRCNDVEKVDNDRCDDQREPYLLYAELSVLAELVVKRSRNVLEENYLFLCKSSDRDLNDGDASVTEEGQSDYEIQERNPAVDGKESDEESERS